MAATRDETATARTIVLDVPGWPGHLAGQHVDVRLTAPDGYSTERSYSIASAPPDGGSGPPVVELTVQRLEDGEVSPYLTQTLAVGYPLELRGPVGGWFVWNPDGPASTRPVLLVAGGSGVVPLMAMIRERAAAGSHAPFKLIYSVRDPGAVLYAGELEQREQAGDGLEVTYVYTRTAPPGSSRAHRADQRRDPRLGRVAAGGVPGGVRVRPDRVRRGRRRPAGARGPWRGRHQDRTFRPLRRQAMSDYMDGNMLGGKLGELFTMDVTSAMLTCVSCGASWAIAQARVYPHAPGMVARCPTCDAVLLRLVRGPDRAWLDLRGITCLEVAVPDR